MQTATLRRVEVRRIFARHYGASLRLSREIGVSPMSVSQWLRGKFKSRRIEAAATERALELLSTEAASESRRAEAKQLLERIVADEVVADEVVAVAGEHGAGTGNGIARSFVSPPEERAANIKGLV